MALTGPGRGSLSIFVKDSATQLGIPNCRVIWSLGETSTDSTGIAFVVDELSGTDDFRFDKDGYTEIIVNLTIVTGQVKEYDIIMDPIAPPPTEAIARFTSEPSGATIIPSGETPFDNTPADYISTSRIDKDFTLKLTGYIDVTFSVTVELGETKSFNTILDPVAPPPDKGYIRGKVTHSLLGTPLGMVTVIWGTFSSVTDANGDYVIEITEGLSQLITVDFPNFEHYEAGITAGPGDDITHNIALVPTEPAEGWGEWFKDQIQTSFDTAFNVLKLLTNPIKDAIVVWLLAEPSRILILEPFAEWLGQRFVDTYPEWESYRDAPKGSITLIALIGMIAGLLGFGSYIQHLRKEIPEGPGMAVWAMIEAEDWVGANAANQKFRDTILYVTESWFSQLTWLNPITHIFANITKDAQLAQADSYQAIIDANLVTEATLIINSSPSGAKIHIDDVYTFNITNTTIKVTPGTRKLTLKLEGYEDHNETFTVAEGETKNFDIPLTAIPTEELGSLSVSSNPAGAKIYKDGVFMFEYTNTTLTMAAGTYEFTLKLTDYEDVSKSITIVKDQTETWHEDLVSVIIEPVVDKGYLDVRSDPVGAKIYQDGVYIFEHTNTVLTVPVGTYTFTLKKTNYKDVSKEITVEKDVTTSWHEVMELTVVEEDITLTINSTPTGAKIYIDDVFKFEYTNTTIKAPAGLHKLTLKLSGYKDHNLPYDWPAGTVKTLHVPLQLYEEDDPVVDQPAEEVVIPMEPVEEPTFNSWKVTIRAKDSITGTDVAAWILIDDVFKGVTTPAIFYLAPESTYNIKTRLKGYRQGEVTYTTKPLPAA